VSTSKNALHLTQKRGRRRVPSKIGLLGFLRSVPSRSKENDDGEKTGNGVQKRKGTILVRSSRDRREERGQVHHGAFLGKRTCLEKKRGKN